MDDSALVAGPSGYGRIVHDPWRSSEVLRRPLLSGRLADLARTLLGETPVLFQDHLVSKTPGTVDAVKWHQDYSYWPLDSAKGLTMWVALDDATLDNGCLHYLPGSHLQGERQPADFVAGAVLGRTAALPPLVVDESAAIAVPVAAGTVLVHDPLVLHMSHGNGTTLARRAWSISWVTEGARWQPSHAPHPYNYSLQPVSGAALCTERFPRV
jgi:2-oxoglutarate-dependent dioxygenase